MHSKTTKEIFLMLFVILFGLPVPMSFAQTNVEWTPYISVRGEYDDNVNLAPDGEESDYLLMVSPGIDLSLVAEHTELSFGYSPTFVWYAKENNNNTTRHRGTLTLAQEISERLTLDLDNAYTVTEDPREEREAVDGAVDPLETRGNRDKYHRNDASVELTYLFGPANELSAGYRHEYLKNDDDTIDDGRDQNPFVALTYQFDVQNSVDLEYGYRKSDFWNHDPAATAADDFTGHEPSVGYTHTFRPNTSVSLRYDYITRDFDKRPPPGPSREDYDVHEGTIGFDHAFSAELDVSASGGYFLRKGDDSEDDSGFSGDASLTKTFERGSINIRGEGGWDEIYLEADDRGFTEYWRTDTSIEYRILERLTGYVDGYYRYDRDDADRDSKTYRGSFRLDWQLHQWFSLSLDYAYTKREDDVPTSEYSDNRVSLLLTAERLYRR